MTIRDAQKAIVFWNEQAHSALDSAAALYKSRQWLHALFFCHLAIEKILKALVISGTKAQPPFVHNLTYLAGKTSLELSKEQVTFLETTNKYNLEGRYPEYRSGLSKSVDRKLVQRQLQATKEFVAWCAKQL